MPPLSPRAQEILEAIERDAQRRRAGDGAVPAEAPEAAGDDAQGPPADDAELLAVIDDVAEQTDRARGRLATLSSAIEDIATRLGVADAGGEPAPVPSAPAAARTPSAPPAAIPSAPAAADARPERPPRPGGRIGAAAYPVDTELFRGPGAPAAARTGRAPAPPSSTGDPAGPEAAGGAPLLALGDSARLVAVEMAVTGSSRADVAERLRELYGLDDVAEILDDVFGPGSDDATRVPLP